MNMYPPSLYTYAPFASSIIRKYNKVKLIRAIRENLTRESILTSMVRQTGYIMTGLISKNVHNGNVIVLNSILIFHSHA